LTPLLATQNVYLLTRRLARKVTSFQNFLVNNIFDVRPNCASKTAPPTSKQLSASTRVPSISEYRLASKSNSTTVDNDSLLFLEYLLPVLETKSIYLVPGSLVVLSLLLP